MSDFCSFADAKTEMCSNDRCPLFRDYCPVVYSPGVCKYDSREEKNEARAIRKKLGLKQEAFGRLLGVSQACVCRWETGRQRPPMEKIKKLEETWAEE